MNLERANKRLKVSHSKNVQTFESEILHQKNDDDVSNAADRRDSGVPNSPTSQRTPVQSSAETFEKNVLAKKSVEAVENGDVETNEKFDDVSADGVVTETYFFKQLVKLVNSLSTNKKESRPCLCIKYNNGVLYFGMSKCSEVSVYRTNNSYGNSDFCRVVYCPSNPTINSLENDSFVSLYLEKKCVWLIQNRCKQVNGVKIKSSIRVRLTSPENAQLIGHDGFNIVNVKQYVFRGRWYTSQFPEMPLVRGALQQSRVTSKKYQNCKVFLIFKVYDGQGEESSESANLEVSTFYADEEVKKFYKSGQHISSLHKDFVVKNGKDFSFCVSSGQYNSVYKFVKAVRDVSNCGAGQMIDIDVNDNGQGNYTLHLGVKDPSLNKTTPFSMELDCKVISENELESTFFCE